MNNISKIKKKYACIPYRYTIKKDVTIIDTDDGHFVFKKRNRNNKTAPLYKYLSSRGFDYYPKLINSDDEFDIYEYVEDINTPIEQKAQDIMILLGILHDKTTYYKEMDIDECKEIYENTIKKLEDINDHYTNIMDNIEEHIYMSPAEYLIARNISNIYGNLVLCRKEIDEWYKLMKDKPKKRMVTIHNNIDTSHLIRNDNLYLLSWDNAKTDMPIYDLYNFYRHNALDFDFDGLFNIYEQKYPLQDDEKKLLYLLISIPEKVDLVDTEYQNCKRVNKTLDYMYKTNLLTKPYYTPQNTDETE